MTDYAGQVVANEKEVALKIRESGEDQATQQREYVGRALWQVAQLLGLLVDRLNEVDFSR